MEALYLLWEVESAGKFAEPSNELRIWPY